MKSIILALLLICIAEAISPTYLEQSLNRVRRSISERFYSSIQPNRRAKRENIDTLLLGGEDNLGAFREPSGPEGNPFAALFGHPGKGAAPEDNPFAALFGAQAKGKGKGEPDAEAALAAGLFGSLFGGAQGGNGGNFFQNAMCFQGCEEKLEKLNKYSSDESDESSEEINFLEGSGESDEEGFAEAEFERRRKRRSTKVEFDAKLPNKLPFGNFMDKKSNESFNATEFNEMCGDFIDAKDCLDQCGAGFFTNMLKGVFRPLEYMCIVEKDNFVKFGDCAEEADTTECDNLCGNETFIDGKTKKMERTKNLQEAQKEIGDMCTFVQCQLDCSKPKIVEACEDEKAGEVFEGAMAHLIGGVTSTFESIGFGLLKSPESCTILSDKAPILPSQIEEQEQEMEQTQVGASQALSPLQEKALNLEIQKLEAEIENLKLEKQVLLMQLDKLQGEMEEEEEGESDESDNDDEE